MGVGCGVRWDSRMGGWEWGVVAVCKSNGMYFINLKELRWK